MLTGPGYFTSDADLITPNTAIYGDSMATDWNSPDYAYGYEVPMDIRVDLDSLRQRALLYGATPVPMHDSYSVSAGSIKYPLSCIEKYPP